MKSCYSLPGYKLKQNYCTKLTDIPSSNIDLNIFCEYTDLLSNWNKQSCNVKRDAKLNELNKHKNMLGFCKKTIQTLRNYDSKISRLNNDLVDHQEYVMMYGTNKKQQVYIELDCVIEDKYLNYIHTYGLPKDGIFFKDLLE